MNAGLSCLLSARKCVSNGLVPGQVAEESQIVLETSDDEIRFVKYEVAELYSGKLADLLEGVTLKKM
jgi:hypothetical protein